jgi:hypothetical protein
MPDPKRLAVARLDPKVPDLVRGVAVSRWVRKVGEEGVVDVVEV